MFVSVRSSGLRVPALALGWLCFSVIPGGSLTPSRWQILHVKNRGLDQGTPRGPPGSVTTLLAQAYGSESHLPLLGVTEPPC